MRKVWIIAKREISSFFDSLMAYIILGLFLGFSGLFTWMIGSDIFMVGQASLRGFFSIAYWTLFFIIPALTMRLLAEERKTGTIELLLTKAVSDRQVILGKFLATLILITVALACTLPYVITLANIGNLDNGGVICGYMGLVLMSAAYVAIGIFTSSITANQIVAFMLSLVIGLFFHIIFGALAGQLTGTTAAIFNTMNLQTHFESISRGVIDTKDILYFLSITAAGLMLSEYSLSKRNIKAG